MFFGLEPEFFADLEPVFVAGLEKVSFGLVVEWGLDSWFPERKAR
jgi:hypothetical protein